MFERIDEKLKNVAMGFFWIDAILSVIASVVLAVMHENFLLLMAPVGVLIA